MSKVRLSLPVERISRLAPKHQTHGTPIEFLVPASVLASLGIEDGVASTSTKYGKRRGRRA